MMSELFTYKGDDEHYFIKTKNKQYAGYEVADLLNSQSKLISAYKYEFAKLQMEKNKLKEINGDKEQDVLHLYKENEQLRQMIKENVFQRYSEGSLADLKFKAIAYDDIVKVEMPNELESKVIVYCKQGKKENIMSYCQMFIPFGIYYEIKEVIDDE